jgi:carbamoyl-phosphate synthase small subunit
MGTLTHNETPAEAYSRLQSEPSYEGADFVAEVSTPITYDFQDGLEVPPGERPRVVVLDLGVKRNIMRILKRRGCAVTAVPHQTTAEEILSMNPSGVLLSPGPGDPRMLDHVVATAQRLIGRSPLMGICLGHQVVGRAFGAGVYKLKFGHRGANHPVRDERTGRVYITSQNHGYAIDDRLEGGVRVSQIHLNDDTVEGLEHTKEPVFTIQYHSEASPGPNDTEFLFDRFMAAVRGDD